jgi:arsenate reductase
MAGPSAQVFGTPDSQATRAALRFFKERRMDVHFVDISR